MVDVFLFNSFAYLDTAFPSINSRKGDIKAAKRWVICKMNPDMIRNDLEVVEAEDEVNLEEIHRTSLCLAGRLWTDSSFNTGSLQSTIRQIWRLKNGVEIREIGENIFFFPIFLLEG